MAEIADSIQARIDELVYPTSATHPDANERRAAQHDRQAIVRTIEADFATELADEYLYEVSESRRQALGQLVYDQAWDHGHSSGYGEVENYYSEFAETALKIYKLATS